MRLVAVVAFLFAAPLFGQGTCTLLVTPTSFSIPAAGYTGTIAVTQPTGSTCDSFAVSTQAIWLHASTVGDSVPKTFTFIADANQGATSRTGVIRVGLQNVTITQDAAVCNFGIDPKSQNFGIEGSSLGSFKVTANCQWSAFQSAGWISFPLRPQGSSDGTVAFGVDRNTCVAGRSGAITLATGLPTPPIFAITQDGSQDNLALSATSATAPSDAKDYRITVTTGDSCDWSAFSDVTWMTISNGSPGKGNGGIVYHLLENKFPAPRVGSLHVGALTYTVTQQAPPPPPVVLSSVANAASYFTDSISPGEIVTLFGSNLGPGSIVTLQVKDGVVTNNLGGTQVFFDDVAAPMIYSLAGQVSAVVPYTLAGKTSTKVQVQYQGVASNTKSVLVQDATPAIFSIDASGGGPGAILNQDFTLNSSANPALRGSVIAIYLTGGGVTTPAAADGSVTAAPPPLFLLAQTPTVTIGGVNAVVKYAGAAPGSVAGLTQINVEVPAGAPAGIAVAVAIKIGSFQGSPAVTVSVK